MTRLTAQAYTVAWLCALPLNELVAATAMLDEEHDSLSLPNHDENTYTYGSIGRHNVVIACMPPGQPGKVSASKLVQPLSQTFPNLEIHLFVGIGGGVPRIPPPDNPDEDIHLGDVVIGCAEKTGVPGVVQWDLVRYLEDGNTEPLGILDKPDRRLLSALSLLLRNRRLGRTRFLEHLKRLQNLPGFSHPGLEHDKLFKSTYRHVSRLNCSSCDRSELIERPPRANQDLVFHQGTIVSGDTVMKNPHRRDQISQIYHGALCFEQEAAGIMDDKRCLIIRGIADYADSHQNGSWQNYAAGTAAAFAREFLFTIQPQDVKGMESAAEVPLPFPRLKLQKAAPLSHQDRTIFEPQQYLSKLPYAAHAAFDSSDQQHDPLCLQNTRVNVLDQIRAWADGADERCSFWLNGMAGTGKSTIARTIAREYYDLKRLGGSFFFSRGREDRSQASKFITTIAVQLAHLSSVLKDLICTAIAEHHDLATQSFSNQWKHLILQPLSVWMAASNQPPLILVIDALDECDGEKDVGGILRLFTELNSLEPIHLRIFVTSRPEVPIRLGFRNMPEIIHRDLVLNNVPREIIDHDIAIYFRQELRGIELSAQSITCLIEKACGLFIWAATVCRFIKDGKRVASKRLSLILQGGNRGRNPEKELDQIYTKILSDSISGDYAEEEKEELFYLFRSIVGVIIILFNQLSIKALSELLDIQRQEVVQTLDDLHSVLDVPESQAHSIRLLHPSFRDFLLSKERCQDPQLRVDDEEVHGVLADSCLRLLSDKLTRDICDLRAPGALAKDIQGDQIEKCLPAELQYACLYWVQHLQCSKAKLFDDDKVHIFLKNQLLHWLEALSLMGKISEGVLAIASLERLVLTQESPSLHAFIYDAKRFALNYRSIIEEAPLQIYYSALIFAPELSVVRKQFEDQISGLVTKLPRVPKKWNSALMTLEGHLNNVAAVAFSPDGSLVVSASDDKTIRLWDSATGTSLATLEGHSNRVNAVAFSPDGKWVVSASDDKTVRLWDSATGTSLATLKGHSEGVAAVAFSQDGKLVASGSGDKTVRLWDSVTGASLTTFKDAGYQNLLFSSDGLYLETNQGLFDISSFSSKIPSQSKPVRELFVKGSWVIHKTNKFLWLPSEYRAARSAGRSYLLVLGHDSGHVTFLEVEPS